MKSKMKLSRTRSRGAAMVEYVLLLVAIIGMAAAGMRTLGKHVKNQVGHAHHQVKGK